jgi:hypothetical protein
MLARAEARPNHNLFLLDHFFIEVGLASFPLALPVAALTADIRNRLPFSALMLPYAHILCMSLALLFPPK